jgi:RNA polymerase sigma-54 factor
MVAMELDFDQLQEQRQRNLPRLIEANYLLNLSSQELEAVIATEISANPALEVEDHITCPLCGGAIDGGYCPTCLVSQNGTPAQTPNEPGDDDFDRIETIYQPRSADEEFDEVTLIADEMDLPQQLLADVHTVLDPADYAIAEYLIDALDERGFLDIDLAEIADICGRDLAAVEHVLRVVQEMAPAGVAARDLRECLLLQLKFLRASDVEIPPLVEPIIQDYLTELGNHRYQHIARQLHVSPEDVGEAHDFIQAYLSPHPLQNHLSKTWQSPAQTPYVAPDVLISLVDGELKVEITGSSQAQLRVNSLYDGLAARLRRRARADNEAAAAVIAQTSDEDRDHIRDSVSRAKQFISKIHQRRETLLKISTCICELQEDFLREGVRELKPLTRSQVAQQIGVHESTVSRATANKFVMLPNRKVIPFSDFFTPSLSVKDVIKELIENESAAGHPLSDMRIRELLLQRGYRIARRTVAKYRSELHILPSTVR